jgi:heptosyltransferase-1
MERPIRLLIVRVGAMGDVLHGLPAVTALKLRHPDWIVGWAVEPRWTPLLSRQVIDSIHPVPTRAWKQHPFSRATLRDLVTLRRDLRAQRYDVCVDLQGSIRSALIGRMASAPRFLGSAKPRERQARAFYTERVQLRAESVIQQACELVGAVVGEVFTPANLNIPKDNEAERWFQRTIGDDGLVLIAPTAGWGAKQWPAARYAEVARALRNTRLRVFINAAMEQDPVAQAITLASGARTVACGVAQLAAMTRHAALVIGGDTGPVHLAAAIGTPVVALFGPTDPRRNGPSFVGAQAIVLRDPSSELDHRRHLETEAGLSKIMVEEVLAAAHTSLAATAGARAHG